MAGLVNPNHAWKPIRVTMNGPDWWRTCEYCGMVFETRRKYKRHEKKVRRTGHC